MHTRFLVLCFALVFTGSLTRAAPAFTAHEWGTLTTISGSDGTALPWWTPTLEGPSALPEFVRPILMFGKAGPPTLIRMETPVIYFYPVVPMSVTAGVSFPTGRLTEVFPSLTPQIPEGGFSSGFASQYAWTADLLPPTKINATDIPPVKTRGAHYQHAREVPEAWIVRSHVPLNDQDKSGPMQTEKFIFYRGTGGGQLPLQVALAADGSAAITSWTAMTTDAYLLHVSAGIMHWRKVRIDFDRDHSSGPFQTAIEAPDHTSDVDSLASALRQTVVDAGLTKDEAAAMVATWTDAWLREEGDRLLYLLPRSWIDNMLPLTLKPAPAKLERVFVARAEVFSPGQERKLADAFNLSLTPEALAESIADLSVGRFAPAGLERVIKLNETSLRDAFTRAAGIAQKQKLPD